MKEEEKTHVLMRPMLWGCIGTGLIFLIGLWMALLPACYQQADSSVFCTTKWSYLSQARPNEVGDTLAGFAGALAFIWIIVTVAMQSKELQAQREELSLTRAEARRTAEALDAQTQILREENESRRQERASIEFESLISQIAQEIRFGTLSHVYWDFEVRQGELVFARDEISPFDPDLFSDLEDRGLFQIVAKQLFAAEMNLAGKALENIVFNYLPPKSHLMVGFYDLFVRLPSLETLLPSSELPKLSMWRLKDIERSLAALLDAKVWSDD